MGHRLRVFRGPCRALAGHDVAVLLINAHAKLRQLRQLV